MSAIVVILVVFASLLVVAGGVWVAVALIVALREPQPSAPSTPQPTDDSDRP